MFEVDEHQERRDGFLIDARVIISLRQATILKLVASVLAAIATLVRILHGG
jgi:hypothetical protein